MSGAGRLVDALGLPHGHLVVVSPHLDDATLSLGGVIAAATAASRRVTVVTVFAGDPGSQRPAGEWDRRTGFETEGEAYACRREEDRRACEVLGARPVWLPFADHQYDGDAGDAALVAAVHDLAGDADAVLLPGHPLTNGDHARVTRILLASAPAARRVGLYMEQPYAFRAGVVPSQATNGGTTAGGGAWSVAGLRRVDRMRKVRAVHEYRSQAAALGLARRGSLPLLRLLSSSHPAGCEAVRWITSDEPAAGASSPV